MLRYPFGSSDGLRRSARRYSVLALRHGGWVLPILAIALTDWVVRHRVAGMWGARDWALYGASCGFALACARMAAWAITAWRQRQPWLWLAALLPLGGFSAVLLAAHLLHFRFFGVHPDLMALTRLLRAPQASLLLIRDGISAPALGLLAALTVVCAAGWSLTVSAFPWQETPVYGLRRPGTWLTVLIAVLLAPWLRSQVPQAQGRYLPSVSLMFTAELALESYWPERGEARRPRRGPPVALPVESEPPPFNVLLVIAESMRAGGAAYDGNPRNTTPQVGAFFGHRQLRIVNFPFCYSNSTGQFESVSSLLTGVHPLQDLSQRESAPLVFEYAKMFRGSYAFLLSAQAYELGNFRGVVQSAELDQLLYQEISSQPRYNSVGMDDHQLLAPLTEILQGLPPQVRFFGILHLMGNHFPYRVPDSFKRWGPQSPLADYDNSILYGDDFMGRALALLEQSKRLDDTLILFTSNHGEGFGEHGISGHGRSFFEEMIHIPCWVHLPKGVRGSQRSALLANRQRVITNLDLVPTVVDLLGLTAIPPVADAMDGLWGQSLARPLPAQRVVVAANGGTAARIEEGFAILRGTERLLYFDPAASARYQFTDLARDPAQSRNLWNFLSRQEQAQWRRILGNYPVLERELLPLLNAAGPPR